MTAPLLVRAARREPVERTPVWFMRQAGRSLPEYRAIRERHAFFEVADTPELCAEVTLQPVRRHGVDAAVLFADIMTPVLGMGIDVELVEGVGPVVERPIAERRRRRAPARARPRRGVRARCSRRCGSFAPSSTPERAVIGFCGGPFTVAGYLVEGRPSRELPRTKALMLSEPETWDALMAKLAETFAAYVAAKVRAGADVDPALRLVGRARSRPRSTASASRRGARAILAAVDVPTIHFGTGATHLLPEHGRRGRRRHRPRLAAAARRRLGASCPSRAVQGNLDPAALAGAVGRRRARGARRARARRRAGPGHIFNLGHGVLPETDPDVLDAPRRARPRAHGGDGRRMTAPR